MFIRCLIFVKHVIYMELKTSVIKISGSYYVLIPAPFAEYCKLRKTDEAKIKCLEHNKLGVTFPVW